MFNSNKWYWSYVLRFKLQKPHVGGGIIRYATMLLHKKKRPWDECLMLEMVTHHYKPQNK